MKMKHEIVVELNLMSYEYILQLAHENETTIQNIINLLINEKIHDVETFRASLLQEKGQYLTTRKLYELMQYEANKRQT